MSRWIHQDITTTTASAWTAPGGVFAVMLDGWGGGGGGGGGMGGATSSSTNQGTGGAGGGGALRRMIFVPVTPGTAYDVSIGSGGAGGTGGAVATGGTSGSDGASTTFAVHGGATLATFAGGGYGSGTPGLTPLVGTASYLITGGTNTAGSKHTSPQNTADFSAGGLSIGPSYGGWSATIESQSDIDNGAGPTAGGGSSDGFAGGAAGTNGTTSTGLRGVGGGGGGAGPNGNGQVGGAGGNGGSGSNPGPGKRPDGTTNTAAQPATTNNTGAGGGGGGGGGSSSNLGSAGGGGGGGDSGFLRIIWFQP